MSLKRIPPTFWLRIKSGWRIGVGAFVLVAGLAGVCITAVSSTGQIIPVWAIICVGIICLFIALGVSYFRGKMKHLPDSFVDEISTDGQYRCEYCTPERLREACEMSKPYYGHEYVSADIAEQWRMKNPKGFVEILNSDGELCACFGVLAMTKSFMEQFAKGRVSDTQLREDSICNFEDSKKSSRLYISGVVVRNPSTHRGSKRARVMIWAMLHYIKRLYGLRRVRQLYALAVNRESERLLRKLEFDLTSSGKHRVDKCNMYCYSLSKESWWKLINRVGDCSPMCKCAF